MLFVSQRIDDVELAAGRGNDRGLLLLKGSNTSARTHRSRLRATSSSGSRTPSANCARQVQRVATKFTDGDLEGGSRPQRRLLEEQRHVEASQHRRRLAAEPAFGLHLRRDREQPIEIDRLRSRIDRKSLREGHRRRTGRSRAVFPVDPHVLGA